MRYQDQFELALTYSTQAVNLLKSTGIRSALRMEEILLDHYLILEATGHSQEAGTYLEEAYSIVQQKAASFQDSSYQRIFRERVPISKAIVKASEQQAQSQKAEIASILVEDSRNHVDNES
jgi:hypothetical protein